MQDDEESDGLFPSPQQGQTARYVSSYHAPSSSTSSAPALLLSGGGSSTLIRRSAEKLPTPPPLLQLQSPLTPLPGRSAAANVPLLSPTVLRASGGRGAAPEPRLLSRSRAVQPEDGAGSVPSSPSRRLPRYGRGGYRPQHKASSMVSEAESPTTPASVGTTSSATTALASTRSDKPGRISLVASAESTTTSAAAPALPMAPHRPDRAVLRTGSTAAVSTPLGGVEGRTAAPLRRLTDDRRSGGSDAVGLSVSGLQWVSRQLFHHIVGAVVAHQWVRERIAAECCQLAVSPEGQELISMDEVLPFVLYGDRTAPTPTEAAASLNWRTASPGLSPLVAERGISSDALRMYYPLFWLLGPLWCSIAPQSRVIQSVSAATGPIPYSRACNSQPIHSSLVGSPSSSSTASSGPQLMVLLLFTEQLLSVFPEFPLELLHAGNPAEDGGAASLLSRNGSGVNGGLTSALEWSQLPYDELWSVISLPRMVVLFQRWGVSPLAAVRMLDAPFPSTRHRGSILSTTQPVPTGLNSNAAALLGSSSFLPATSFSEAEPAPHRTARAFASGGTPGAASTAAVPRLDAPLLTLSTDDALLARLQHHYYSSSMEEGPEGTLGEGERPFHGESHRYDGRTPSTLTSSAVPSTGRGSRRASTPLFFSLSSTSSATQHQQQQQQHPHRPRASSAALFPPQRSSGAGVVESQRHPYAIQLSSADVSLRYRHRPPPQQPSYSLSRPQTTEALLSREENATPHVMAARGASTNPKSPSLFSPKPPSSSSSSKNRTLAQRRTDLVNVYMQSLMAATAERRAATRSSVRQQGEARHHYHHQHLTDVNSRQFVGDLASHSTLPSNWPNRTTSPLRARVDRKTEALEPHQQSLISGKQARVPRKADAMPSVEDSFNIPLYTVSEVDLLQGLSELQQQHLQEDASPSLSSALPPVPEPNAMDPPRRLAAGQETRVQLMQRYGVSATTASLTAEWFSLSHDPLVSAQLPIVQETRVASPSVPEAEEEAAALETAPASSTLAARELDRASSAELSTSQRLQLNEVHEATQCDAGAAVATPGDPVAPRDRASDDTHRLASAVDKRWEAATQTMARESTASQVEMSIPTPPALRSGGIILSLSSLEPIEGVSSVPSSSCLSSLPPHMHLTEYESGSAAPQSRTARLPVVVLVDLASRVLQAVGRGFASRRRLGQQMKAASLDVVPRFGLSAMSLTATMRNGAAQGTLASATSATRRSFAEAHYDISTAFPVAALQYMMNSWPSSTQPHVPAITTRAGTRESDWGHSRRTMPLPVSSSVAEGAKSDISSRLNYATMPISFPGTLHSFRLETEEVSSTRVTRGSSMDRGSPLSAGRPQHASPLVLSAPAYLEPTDLNSVSVSTATAADHSSSPSPSAGSGRASTRQPSQKVLDSSPTVEMEESSAPLGEIHDSTSTSTMAPSFAPPRTGDLEATVGVHGETFAFAKALSSSDWACIAQQHSVGGGSSCTVAFAEQQQQLRPRDASSSTSLDLSSYHPRSTSASSFVMAPQLSREVVEAVACLQRLCRGYAARLQLGHLKAERNEEALLDAMLHKMILPPWFNAAGDGNSEAPLPPFSFPNVGLVTSSSSKSSKSEGIVSWNSVVSSAPTHPTPPHPAPVSSSSGGAAAPSSLVVLPTQLVTPDISHYTAPPLLVGSTLPPATPSRLNSTDSLKLYQNTMTPRPHGEAAGNGLALRAKAMAIQPSRPHQPAAQRGGHHSSSSGTRTTPSKESSSSSSSAAAGSRQLRSVQVANTPARETSSALAVNHCAACSLVGSLNSLRSSRGSPASPDVPPMQSITSRTSHSHPTRRWRATAAAGAVSSLEGSITASGPSVSSAYSLPFSFSTTANTMSAVSQIEELLSTRTSEGVGQPPWVLDGVEVETPPSDTDTIDERGQAVHRQLQEEEEEKEEELAEAAAFEEDLQQVAGVVEPACFGTAAYLGGPSSGPLVYAEAVLCLQRVGRGYLCRRHLHFLFMVFISWMEIALLHRVSAGYLARKRLGLDYVVSIIVRRQMEYWRTRNEASVVVQRVVRGFIARQRVRALQRRVATRIELRVAVELIDPEEP